VVGHSRCIAPKSLYCKYLSPSGHFLHWIGPDGCGFGNYLGENGPECSA
jgi:hypothetical protein